MFSKTRFFRNSSRNYSKVTPGYFGHIDRIDGGIVHGWVRRATDTQPLKIDLLIGDVPVLTEIVANQHRADVEEAGHGTGVHGFACRLPRAQLSDGTEVMVEIRLSTDGTVLLQRQLSVETIPGPGVIAEIKNTTHVQSVVPVSVFEQVPDLFDCDARIENVDEMHMRGWAVDRNNLGRIFTIEILIDDLPFTTLRNDQRRDDLLRAGRSAGKGGIRAPLPFALLEPGTHKVTLRLPDGQTVSREMTINSPAQRPRVYPNVAQITPGQTAVIVPIYNAADDLKVCIARLASFTSQEVEILLIDDRSPDPEIARILAAATEGPEAHPNMRCLFNDRNLGFSGTVNRGLEAIGRKNAILLNSDARVTPGWLEGMLRAASARPRVATVTAMSDRAGAFSAPRIGNDNELPPGVDEITYARAFRRRGLGLYPIVPTGNGFCMFVSRACLDDVGPLDTEAFPRGYGEENDFCMRAGRVGWTHLVDDRTYVFHDRSKSFADTKTELMAAGRAVVDARYPEYKKAIGVFSTGMEMQTARMRAALALQDCATPEAALPRLMFVVATQTGGTPQTNLDLMGALAEGIESWLMRCDSTELVLSRFDGIALHEIRRHRLAETLEPIRHTSAEYDQIVSEWLTELDIDLVHIRHLAWHSVNLPRLARAAGARVVFSFHDFYTLCPTVKMLRPRADDPEGRRSGATTIPELWPEDSMPPLTDAWESFWRDRFGKALSVCDAFVTTSDSARDTILTHLPGIDPARFHVIPHGRDFAEFRRLRHRPAYGTPLRILVPGNISLAKGLGVIRDLLEVDRAGLLEFHILGKVDDREGIIHPRLIQHGTYTRNDFASRVERLDVHLGAVFSVWDETFCHTLTELWSVGVPPIVFDFPTVAGRVRTTGAGWVLSHEDVSELYKKIIMTAFDASEQDRVEAALAAWQEGAGKGQTTRLMAARYLNVYRQVKGLTALPLVAVVAPSEPSLSRANASTEIRLWERTRPGPERQAIYVRMTPQSLLANLRDPMVSELMGGAVLQRNVVPATMVTSLLTAFTEAGLGYVIDLDDDLLAVPEDKDPTGIYAAYAPYLKQLISAASTLTVSTEPLRTSMAKLHPRVQLLENRLSTPLWRGLQPSRVVDNKVRALYFGGFTHAEDLAMIMPALEAVAARHPDFRLALVGVQRMALPTWIERIEVPSDAKSYAHFVPWLRTQAKHMDFAIAPLQDTPFNHCKSGLKAMEAAALGLPVLASDLPMYRTVCDGMDAATLVPEGTDFWVMALEAEIERARTGGADPVQIRRSVLDRYEMTTTVVKFDKLVTAVT